MSYDISDILKLSPAEQEEIANAIFKHLTSLDEGEDASEEELDKRFEKIESGNFKGHTIDEIKVKLAAKWQNE